VPEGVASDGKFSLVSLRRRTRPFTLAFQFQEYNGQCSSSY